MTQKYHFHPLNPTNKFEGRLPEREAFLFYPFFAGSSPSQSFSHEKSCPKAAFYHFYLPLILVWGSAGAAVCFSISAIAPFTMGMRQFLLPNSTMTISSVMSMIWP